MADIFKSYDVRGIYGGELTDELAYKIGRAFAQYTGAKNIAVGRDNRISSPALSEALIRGLTDSGVSIIDIGLISTPMLYFASATLPVQGAIMVTASHNPPEYNGFKFCRKNAVPIGLTSGLAEISNLAHASNFPSPEVRGTVSHADISSTYYDMLKTYADWGDKKFLIATDAAHAMGALETPLLKMLPGITVDRALYDTLEAPGTCPHAGDPHDANTLTELRVAVRGGGADMGIAFDGDADRIGFVDEEGRVVPMDLVTALVGKALLFNHPNATILYDLRSSRSVKEAIESAGGIAHESMVGHANIKMQMIEERALFAGEGSGHYYFALAGYKGEMGMLPAIFLMNLMARTGKKLSTLVNEIKKYAHTGEINVHILDAKKVFERVRIHYGDGKISNLDGIKIDYPDWWFSFRASNTEPVMRLNLEANTPELMEEKKAELLNLIKDN